jgi:pimeloyl-ACP methyl ester carboxylesterase
MVELDAQTFGNPDDPAVLFIAGMAASMLWWPADICETIAAAGFFVVRFDQRDTGRSSSFPLGHPGYSTADLATDALEVLDRFTIRRAHVVGHSLGSLVATILAVDHPERVLTVTLMGSSTGASELPQGTGTWPAMPASPISRETATNYLVESTRACDGDSPGFEDARIRSFITQEVDRASNIEASIRNPGAIEFTDPEHGGHADISQPTLVMHGERDSLLPIAHGEAVARVIPGSEFVKLPDAGHTLLTADPADFTEPLIRHLKKFGY